MTDFFRAPDRAVNAEEAGRERRRPEPHQGTKLDPTVLQVARRLARGTTQTPARATRAEKPLAP